MRCTVGRPKKRPEPFRISGSDVRVRVHSGPDAEGRWRWRAERTVEGKAITVWSGWGSQEEAERQILALLAAPPAPPEPEGLVSVRDLLETWALAQDERMDTSDHTKRSATTGAKRLLAHGLGDVRLDRIDRGSLERWRDASLRSGSAGSTVMRDLKRLRSAWEWAREQGLAPNRTLPRVKVEQRARQPVYTRYTPTRAEIAQILGLVRPEWIRRSLVLLASTGARIGEIASLKWASVSADCAWIDVKGKTGARRVPLHPSVAVEVQGWERGEPTDLVLGVSYNTAVARTQRELGRVSEEVLKIPRVSPNGLRRAMVDALYRAGVPIDVEAALLGHSPQTAIAIYRRVADEDRASAVVRAGVPMPVAPAGQVVPFTRGGKE